jgi:hypothetical protein
LIVPFEIVPDLKPYDARLHDALTRLKSKLRLSASVTEMAKEIKRHAQGVSSLWDSDAWADIAALGDLGRCVTEETKSALTEYVHLKSAREVRQLTKFIWSPRQKRRGRNQEINTDLLRVVLRVVEHIAGRKLSFGHKRQRLAPIGAPTSGPPEGAMLDVLLAALDWAYALPTPHRRSDPLRAESVLSAIKRLRRQSGQN